MVPSRDRRGAGDRAPDVDATRSGRNTFDHVEDKCSVTSRVLPRLAQQVGEPFRQRQATTGRGGGGGAGRESPA